MAAPSNTTRTYYDILGSFELGVNSGISPTLLPKNQLAWALNSTVRGGHITDRPPYNIQEFDFGADTALETLVLSGYFQGAAVYRPDYGPSEIIAQVSGHIVRFSQLADEKWHVTDISIVGDLNSSTAYQCWMWQSEKWLIISDGTGALPIFYDGTSCRRSLGPSVLYATALAFSVVKPPPIGSIMNVTLGVAWSGPFNIPVIMNGAIYQPIENPTGGYNIILQNIDDTPGHVVPDGTDVIIDPNILGSASVAATGNWAGGITHCVIPGYCSTTYTETISVQVNSVTAFSVGQSVLIETNNGTKTFTVSSISAGTSIVVFQRQQQSFLQGLLAPATPPAPPVDTIAAGTVIRAATNIGPSYSVGKVDAFAAPVVGGTLTAKLDQVYSGASNQLCSILGKFYTITPVVSGAGGLTLYLINLSDTSTANYDATEDIYSVPELPAGRMGAYGMGRNWLCLVDGISYIASDIVGGAAGTQASNYRDSVLRISENEYLNGGGTFRLPSSGNIITSMTFSTNLDTSLGQGPLQIGTDTGMFSNLSPTDRTTWTALTNPIQTQSLLGQGPLGQNSTVLANSDILFRSIDGIGSLVIARRNFNEWGNTPISREVQRAFENDNITLLQFGSGVVFDNRLLMTCYPSVSSAGVFHQGLTALNFDLVSNLRGKAPPAYDGLWTGLNLLQCLNGNFSGSGRAFAFGFNTSTNQIELYELMRTDSDHFDTTAEGDTRIEWLFETAALFREDIKPKSELIRLLDAEIEIQDVDGVVDFEIQYKPDYYPCFTTWRSFQICADQTQDNSKPGYRTRLSLGDPTGESCEANNNRLLHVGHFFEFCVKIVGHCKFMGMRVQATTQPESDFAPPVCASVSSATIPVP